MFTLEKDENQVWDEKLQEIDIKEIFVIYDFDIQTLFTKALVY